MFDYRTQRNIQIHSRLGILHRTVQLAIICYIIIYVLIINKGYQSFDYSALSSSTTKVKGTGLTDLTDRPVWDAVDLLIPSQSNGGFFLATNLVITKNQTQRHCAESQDITESYCRADADCWPQGRVYQLGHGVTTGVCNTSTNTCMIRSWCDFERDDISVEHRVNFTDKFTVFIKNHVHFPKYRVSKSNLMSRTNEDYLRACYKSLSPDKHCPIFKINHIVNLAHTNNDETLASEIWKSGGVIAIRIKWDCNLDLSAECEPEYIFNRVDSSTGYNTRIPVYYYKNKTTHRELIKAYGILFKIETEAKARKFDIINLLLNTGSGLGLLGLSSVICDAVLTYVHRHRDYYKQHTTQNLPKRPPQKSMVRATGQRHVYVIENSDSRSCSEC